MSKYVENNVEKLLKEFYSNSRRKMGPIIKQIARAEAVSFARSTQPYTSGDNWDESQKRGHATVEKDIRKIFLTPGQVFASIKRSDAGLADAFWYFFKIGRIAGKRGAQGMLAVSQSPHRDVPIQSFVKEVHKANRGFRGRVVGGAKQIVRSESPLKSYIETKKKRVGFVKSGWATCAKLLKSARGIPGWITRNKGPGSVTDQTTNDANPYVIIHNNVPYANECLPPAAEAEALRGAHDRLTKMVQRALEAAARKKELQLNDT